jgi:hypothetical protein
MPQVYLLYIMIDVANDRYVTIDANDYTICRHAVTDEEVLDGLSSNNLQHAIYKMALRIEELSNEVV